MRRLLPFLVLALVAGLSPAHAATITAGSTELLIQEFQVPGARTLGGLNPRGPAIAVMSDGTVLLGGGPRGGFLYTWSEGNPTPTFLGSVMTAKERITDSRFAVTDIAVLSESAKSAELLVSFPRLTPKRCVEVVVHRVTLNRATNKIAKQEAWFRSKPCVPISAVQHASGRMEVIDATSAYLTVGDLGYPSINNRKKRGDLGSIFKISRTKVTKVSTGHRNAQGIAMVNGTTLMASEHGPRGGDEINIIKQGADYGWPFVTYGEPYGAGDYVRPTQTGTHEGYPQPIKYWVPSIAPTELVQLPATGYGEFNGGLAMGTLKEQVIVFMKLNGLRITTTELVSVDARIRDLDVMPDGRLLASTDDGKLLLIG